MQKTLLGYDKIPQLAKNDVGYATGDARLRPFYTPATDQFPTVVAAKKQQTFHRDTLVQVLHEQYANIPEKEAVHLNIQALAQENTYTIVTAHQPALFLGPLYFLYKAVTAIVTARAAKAETGHVVIPVFVLGSEDHDLDELNHVHLFGKKIVWESPETGAVGSMTTASLSPVLEELKNVLGESEKAAQLFEHIQVAYTQQPTIAAATRALLHHLFGEYGLVVLDMNHPALKRLFIPILRAELLEQPSFRCVQADAEALAQLGFKPQATPREINLFYLRPGMRERIVLENDVYKVLNTNYTFTKEAILAELEAHPEHFSPNVVLRPLYQEWVLPNLAYVGGGGELAYWLERSSLFKHFKVPFPMLVRRHSALWIDRDTFKKLTRLNFSTTRFFDDTDALVRTFIEKNAAATVQLSPEIAELKGIFQRLAEKAAAIDTTLEKAVRADEVKAVGGLEQWESRLLRAEKQKHEVSVNQIRALREKLFPGNGLQERYDNFLPYLLKYDTGFIETLFTHFAPFDAGMVILEDRE
jgi:bacillithiol synthase